MLTPQLEILIGLFIVSLVIWFILIIYKTRLERQEEDKVFLGSTPERMGEDQKKILQKVMGLSKPLWIVGTLTVLFMLCAIGVWIYQGLLSH
ncbi:MAG: hypothetical protein KGL59_11130 [Acidobacteriota bacterium]|jgi:hypothetical protein|nr:hypothetical protein [Acidobacteriota bacterium]